MNAKKRSKRPVQTELPFRSTGRGGPRPGSGPKVRAGRRNVAHRSREEHAAAHPVHVTMRAHRLVPRLRAQRVVTRIVASIGKSAKDTFRVLHFSIQANHVHLLVEAADRTALSRGLQGLSIRIARQVNGLLGRRGSFWGDRYHARPLRTPREVRSGLVYVLMNHNKHERGATGIDPCSSARWFRGWIRPPVREDPDEPPVRAATTWLARVGWKRHGLLHPNDLPVTH